MTIRTLLIFLCINLLLVACNSSQSVEMVGCIPPEEFQDSDIIGTWIGGWSERRDTIILRADGKYKQIIHIQTPAYDYESGWLPWLIEYKQNGIPYLHLIDMRMCVYFDGIDCDNVGGGEQYWYDYCQDEWLQTPNEGVLMILKVPEHFPQSPRSLQLVSLQVHIEEVTTYFLQEP